MSCTMHDCHSSNTRKTDAHMVWELQRLEHASSRVPAETLLSVLESDLRLIVLKN